MNEEQEDKQEIVNVRKRASHKSRGNFVRSNNYQSTNGHCTKILRGQGSAKTLIRRQIIKDARSDCPNVKPSRLGGGIWGRLAGGGDRVRTSASSRGFSRVFSKETSKVARINCSRFSAISKASTGPFEDCMGQYDRLEPV